MLSSALHVFASVLFSHLYYLCIVNQPSPVYLILAILLCHVWFVPVVSWCAFCWTLDTSPVATFSDLFA